MAAGGGAPQRSKPDSNIAFWCAEGAEVKDPFASATERFTASVDLPTKRYRGTGASQIVDGRSFAKVVMATPDSGPLSAHASPESGERTDGRAQQHEMEVTGLEPVATLG